MSALLWSPVLKSDHSKSHNKLTANKSKWLGLSGSVVVTHD